ncbi:uncharacterized protein LOC124143145 isoform X2 [Haliotis rufescens]|uniref:uncharacterized protein LOC124143145 isoform X1 n=1 Tax=Haliotis rufescens TaxID=6454 RepID=UPI001EAFFE27|nr:uncharacterized protein LOC124143145 isoform X1 [Haliotis rufescens]XP_046367931.1 uncharacterized protein LOC124143145 isoform X1 [Haliotis rufescens]XP_048250849.1 uncharacterized protein LOC124143145 isoform X2 [Haliotis rufescens]
MADEIRHGLENVHLPESPGPRQVSAVTPYQSLEESPAPLATPDQGLPGAHRSLDELRDAGNTTLRPGVFHYDRNRRSPVSMASSTRDPDNTMPKTELQIKTFMMNSPDDDDIVPEFIQSVSDHSHDSIHVQPAFGELAPTRRIRSGIPEYILDSMTTTDYTILLVGPSFLRGVDREVQNTDGPSMTDTEHLGVRFGYIQLLNKSFLNGVDNSKIFPVLVKGADRSHLPPWLETGEFYTNNTDKYGVGCMVRKMIAQYREERATHSC